MPSVFATNLKPYYWQSDNRQMKAALTSLADTAVVMAINSIVPPEIHFATISLESRFLYPVKQGIVTARAKVTDHLDNHLEGQATVFNGNERAVLEFTSMFKIARDTRIEGIVFQDS